jgi:hypothetical protein
VTRIGRASESSGRAHWSRYSAYGLEVRAAFRLPGLQRSRSRRLPDVEITRHDHPGDTGSVVLAYDDGCRFALSTGGDRVACGWPTSLTVRDALPYLRGPVFGALLRLRGVIALHASAVVVNGRAIAFLGPPGAGKSTTAAAMAMRGIPVLSDDIVPLQRARGGWNARAGYPTLCLWPESVEGLYGDDRALPLITRNWEKRYLDLQGGATRFAAGGARLGALYVLSRAGDDTAAPSIAAIEGSRAVMALVANTFGSYRLNPAMRREDFLTFSEVAGSVPVRGIRVPDAIGQLSGVCDAILADAAGLER